LRIISNGIITNPRFKKLADSRIVIVIPITNAKSRLIVSNNQMKIFFNTNCFIANYY